MTGRLAPLEMADITNRWQLAIKSAKQFGEPEESLKLAFHTIVRQIETLAKVDFGLPLVGRVWISVSKDNLKFITNIFLLEFCDEVLDVFSEDEAAVMLKQLKTSDVITNASYRGQLEKNRLAKYSSVIDVTRKAIESIHNSLLADVLSGLKKEGVTFAEDEKSK